MEFEHKKSLGQHFLNSDVVPGWMCDAAEISTTDTIVEIGPGTGALTAELLKRGAKVIALETDGRAISILQDKFAPEMDTKQLVLHQFDVREWDPALFNLNPGSFKVVANIPYYLSGLLFRAVLSHKIQPNCLVFLVQKEVAKRVIESVERGGKGSLLSLSTQVYGEPKYVRTVPRGHFTPPPKVDSGIVAIRNISRDKLKNVDEQFFFECLHLGFGQKRKQLIGNLATSHDRKVLTEVFSKLEVPSNIRAEDLSLEKWRALVTELAKLKH